MTIRTMKIIPVLFLFAFLSLSVFYSYQSSSEKKNFTVQEVAQIDSIRKELVATKPGDIIEFNDGSMARVYKNLQEYYPDPPDPRYIPIVLDYLGLGGGRTNVRPGTVKHIYHRNDSDWRTAAERFVLQDLPKEGQEKSVKPAKSSREEMPSWI